MFLHPYGVGYQPWRHGSNMLMVLQHPRTPPKPSKAAMKCAGPLVELREKVIILLIVPQERTSVFEGI